MIKNVQAPESRTAPTMLARVLVVSTRLVAFVLLLVGAVWVGIGRAGLGSVLPTQEGPPSPTTAPSAGSLVTTGLVTLALLLSTRRTGPQQRTDLVQVLGAAWVFVLTVVFAAFRASASFARPDSHCAYASCWPLGYQELAVSLPIVTASLLMVVMATAGRQQARWIRAAAPAFSYLLLTVLQLATWERVVLPVLDSPPPF